MESTAGVTSARRPDAIRGPNAVSRRERRPESLGIPNVNLVKLRRSAAKGVLPFKLLVSI